MNYWLVKSDPDTYSWDNMVKDRRTFWDGVRNYQARNFMKEMKIDDFVLFYHSQSDKSIVGITKVVKEHYPDATTNDDSWVVVELEVVASIKKPITLESVKNNIILSKLPLVTQQRLSVMPLTKEQYDEVINLGNI